MTYTLYEVQPSRSVRCRWTLAELEVPFESIAGVHLFGSDELKRVHPLGKVPAMEIDGRALFESAAICTHLADRHAEKGLIPACGSFERALHDQWVCFTLTELEAHLWSTARNTFVYPEERRMPAIIEQNTTEARRSLAVLDRHLAGSRHLLGERFQVTDIIVGFAINWARRAKLLDDFAHLARYLETLLARPHCPLSRD